MLETTTLNEKHLELRRKAQQHCSINLRGNSKKKIVLLTHLRGKQNLLGAPLLSCHASMPMLYLRKVNANTHTHIVNNSCTHALEPS